MAKKKATEPDGPTFEKSLAELEAIVHRLEDGELSMDEALAAYENGIGRLKRCYQLLDAAEQKIEVLVGVDAEGKATTKLFPDLPTS